MIVPVGVSENPGQLQHRPETVKAKFHYAILLARGLVADLLASWNVAYHALSSSLAGPRPGLVADLLARC